MHWPGAGKGETSESCEGWELDKRGQVFASSVAPVLLFMQLNFMPQLSGFLYIGTDYI